MLLIHTMFSPSSGKNLTYPSDSTPAVDKVFLTCSWLHHLSKEQKKEKQKKKINFAVIFLTLKKLLMLVFPKFYSESCDKSNMAARCTTTSLNEDTNLLMVVKMVDELIQDLSWFHCSKHVMSVGTERYRLKHSISSVNEGRLGSGSQK